MNPVRYGILLLSFMLIISTGFAADVAMVVSGAAVASLEEESWNVETAEMLPENVILTVVKDSVLKLIHLSSDMEYEIPSEAQVKVTAETIEGQDISGKQIKLVNGQLIVDETMNQQTGAAYGDRHLRKKKEDNLRISAKPAPAPVEQPEPKVQNENKFSPELFDEEATPIKIFEADKEKSNNLGIFSGSSEMLDSGDMAQSGPACSNCTKKIFFALPVELADKAKGESNHYQLDNNCGLQIASYSLNLDWVIFECNAINPEKTEFSAVFANNEALSAIQLKYYESLENKISIALQLEKDGHLHQAATLWFRIAEELKLTERVLKMHLNRISAKIVK
ncbi:MAG: hypothetical protein ACOYXC_03650 [Candidatus Rifleibacteriota bacterium]